ncbi:MAG: AAA family ATPase [Cyanobacteria bacterium SBLK]|nr:AAA family ATPase [Cyanobacteria bacterium SBLK]
MNTKEVIEFADRLLLEHRDKSLSDLEKEIIRGTLKDCEYEKIADKTNYTSKYVSIVGAKLWSEFSEILGTEINKKNFKIVIEKLDIDAKIKDNSSLTPHQNVFDSRDSASTLQNVFDSVFQDVTINIGSDPQYPEKSTSKPDKPYRETAPKCSNCYGREEELNTLKHWILEERDRLITILGLPGIGKTTLSLKLAEQVKPHFDIILYRSLHIDLPLHELLANIVESLTGQSDSSRSVGNHLYSLNKALHQQNCLLIFDNFQHVFAPHELAGTYPKKNKKYQLLFELFTLASHQSCLLLCSREKPKEISQWERGKSPIRSLELTGSKAAAIALFHEKELSDERNWQNLIDTCQGNLLQLQETAILIQELFDGDISQFMAYSEHFLGSNLKEKIEQHLDRLSESERKILQTFKGKNVSLPIGKLMSKSGIHLAEFLNILQSLQHRFCLESQQKEEIKYFSLTPILQNYLKSNPFELG